MGDTFNGTDFSAPHIGDNPSARAENFLVDAPAIKISSSLGTESANVIRATLTTQDLAGNTVASQKWDLELRTTDDILATAASQGFGLVASNGTALSTDDADKSPPVSNGNVALLVQANSSGVIAVDIEDHTSALADDMWLRCTPVDRIGVTAMVQVTFA